MQVSIKTVLSSPIIGTFTESMELPTSDKHSASQERERTAINEAQTMKTDAEAQIYLIGDIIGMLDQSLCQPNIQEVLSAAQPFFKTLPLLPKIHLIFH